MMFIKILQKMLNQDLILQIISRKLYKSKKVTDVIKNELGEQIMNEFVGLREKTYIYSVNDGSED